MTNDPYKTPTGPLADPPLRPQRFGLLSSLLLTTVLAAVLSFAVSGFTPAYAAFDAHIPWFTEMVLRIYWAAWFLPLLVIAVWFGWPNPQQRSWAVLAIGLVSIFLLLPLGLAALYLPIFNLGAGGGYT